MSEPTYDQVLSMVSNGDYRMMKSLEVDSGDENQWESEDEKEEVLELLKDKMLKSQIFSLIGKVF